MHRVKKTTMGIGRGGGTNAEAETATPLGESRYRPPIQTKSPRAGCVTLCLGKAGALLAMRGDIWRSGIRWASAPRPRPYLS